MEPEACGQQPQLLLPQQRGHSPWQWEQVAAPRCNPSPWEQQDPCALCSGPPGSSLGSQPSEHSECPVPSQLPSVCMGWPLHKLLFIYQMDSPRESCSEPSQGTQAQQQPQPGMRAATLGAGQALELPQASSQGLSTAPGGTVGSTLPQGKAAESLNTLTCSTGM